MWRSERAEAEPAEAAEGVLEGVTPPVLEGVTPPVCEGVTPSVYKGVGVVRLGPVGGKKEGISHTDLYLLPTTTLDTEICPPPTGALQNLFVRVCGKPCESSSAG